MKTAPKKRYRKGPVNTMDRETCIYLAGLFDGEGCFAVGMTNLRGGMKISACVSLAMRDKQTIDWIAEKLGIPTRQHKLSAKLTGVSRPMYKVVVANVVGIVSLIEQLLPFLITKRRAAETCLAFCRSRIDPESNKAKYGAYSSEEHALYASLRMINRVGVSALTN